MNTNNRKSFGRRLRSLSTALAVTAGCAGAAYCVQVPGSHYFWRAIDKPWTHAIDVASDTIRRSRLLVEDEWLDGQKYSRSSNEGGAIPQHYNQIRLASPTQEQFYSPGLPVEYAKRIIHERAHWWWRRRLNPEQQKAFQELSRQGAENFGRVIRHEIPLQREIVKYNPIYSGIETYRQQYGKRFEETYWGDESFAMIAGLAAEDYLEKVPVEFMPEELKRFYVGFFQPELLTEH